MGEQARSAPCVAWVNAKKSIHAPSIQPFLFAAGNLRNMTNPFSEYSQFDALTVSGKLFKNPRAKPDGTKMFCSAFLNDARMCCFFANAIVKY